MSVTHLGSIIATADATGSSTAIYTYGPFGESSLTTGIRYGYTGHAGEVRERLIILQTEPV